MHFHKHPENQGKSYIVTLGTFHDAAPAAAAATNALVGEGGEFMTGGERERQLHDVYRKPFRFDGKNVAHAPAIHLAGERYSVIWYTHNGQWEASQRPPSS